MTTTPHDFTNQIILNCCIYPVNLSAQQPQYSKVQCRLVLQLTLGCNRQEVAHHPRPDVLRLGLGAIPSGREVGKSNHCMSCWLSCKCMRRIVCIETVHHICRAPADLDGEQGESLHTLEHWASTSGLPNQQVTE